MLVNATYSDEWQGNEDLTAANHMAIEALKQPEQKKGKWISPSQNPEFANKDFFNDCSVCGFTTMDKTDFCPHCGAEMEEQDG